MPIALAILLLSGQAAAPARPASDLTRDLNSAPPAAVQARPAPRPAPQAGTTPLVDAAPPAASTAQPARQPAPARPAAAPAASTTTQDLNSGRAAPAGARPATSTPALTAPRAAAPTTRPAPSASAPASTAATPAAESVDPAAAARADLPFTIELPDGFEIEQVESGPQARIYAVRHDDRSYVMIYSGPASQFPIYDGQLIDAGGRASVVLTENGQRRAVEHMFTRDLESRETHVWISTLEGPDSAVAEQIAQSVEPR